MTQSAEEFLTNVPPAAPIAAADYLDQAPEQSAGAAVQNALPEQGQTLEPSNEVPHGGYTDPEEYLRQLGLAGRDIAGAVPMAVAGVGDLANTAINAATGTANKYAGTNIPPLAMPTDAVQKGLSATGMFPEPQNGVERDVGTAASVLLGGGEQGVQALKQAGSNLLDFFRGDAAATPETSDAMKAIASGFYRQADEAGGTLKPQFTNAFIEKVGQLAPQTAEGKIVAGETPITQLADRMQALRDKPISLQGAQEIDERLGNMIDGEYGPTGLSKDGKQLLDVQSTLRNMINDATPDDIASSAPNMTTLYHGTNVPFAKLDPSRSGGMVFFGETPDVAERYATGGGGQRAKLPDTEKYFVNDDGPQAVVRELGDDGLWHPIGSTNSVGGMVTPNNLMPLKSPAPPMTMKDAQYAVSDAGGTGAIVPKTARVVSQGVPNLKPFDFTDENNIKQIAALTPTTHAGRAVIEAARYDVARGGTTQTNANLWGLTSHSDFSGPQLDKDIFTPLRQQGYNSIRFQDDQHPTIGVFPDALNQVDQSSSANGSGFEMLKQGREAWSQAAKMRDLEKIQTRADYSDNPATTIRSGVRTLLSNAARTRGYSDDELSALQAAAKTGFGVDTLRVFGSRLMPMIASAAGEATGGLPGAAIAGGLTHGASTLARNAAANIQANRLQNVLKVLGQDYPAPGAPTSVPVSVQAPQLLPAGALATALPSGRGANQ